MSLDLEKLNIIIEGSAESATSALDDLIKQLGGLKTAAAQVQEAAGATKTLNGARDAASRAAGATEELSEGLNSIGAAAESSGEAAEGMAGAYSNAVSTVTRYYKLLSTALNSDVITNYGRSVSESGTWDDLANGINKAREEFLGLDSVLAELDDEKQERLLRKMATAYEDYAIKADAAASKEIKRKEAAQAANEKAAARQAEAAAEQKRRDELKAMQAAYDDASKTVRRYYQLLTKLATTNNDISNVGGRQVSESGVWDDLAQAVNQATEKFTQLDSARAGLNDEYNLRLTKEVAKAYEDYAIKLDEVAGRESKVAAETKEIGKAAEKSESQFAKLIASIKRIAFYRMIRSAIRGVTQAVKEGLDVLIEWDRTYGNNTSYAAQTADEIATQWYEVKKAIGAAAMPLIQVALPALTFVMDLVTKIAEIINQIVRAAQGYSDYMKATYNYTRKATDSAKELRRVLFGFDELNVLPSQSGSAAESTVDAIDYIPTDIDDTWATIGQRIVKIGNDLKTNFGGILADIERMFAGTGKVLKGLVTGDWKLVGEGIEDIFLGAAGAVDKGVTGTVNTLWDWLYGEPPKATKLAEEFEKAFEDGLPTAQEMWEIIKAIFSVTKENAGLKLQDFFKDFKQYFYTFLYEVLSYIEERPLLNKLLKTVFGIDAAAIKSEILIKFKTDTTLSPDTQRLYELYRAGYGGNPDTGGTGRGGKQADLSWEGYASGGDPVKGTFFYAGEAGAEVVASTPGGTGVMNMQQMQQAVSNGNLQVVNALGVMANLIVQAIEQKPTDLYIDGDAVGRAATRYQNGRLRATGVPVTARG